MSVSSDIESLFGHFGGDGKHYQEVHRDQNSEVARARWPLLNALDHAQPEAAPASMSRAATAAAAPQAAMNAPRRAAEFRMQRPAAQPYPADVPVRAPLFQTPAYVPPPAVAPQRVDVPFGAEAARQPVLAKLRYGAAVADTRGEPRGASLAEIFARLRNAPADGNWPAGEPGSV